MTFTFTTWTGTKDGSEARTITKPELTGHQVYVRTTHSGVCGTDIHYAAAGIGQGHEGAGVVEAVGPEATHKVGDRVAWGWVHSSCGECSQCLSGYVYLCEKDLHDYGSTELDQGSFSTGGVWDSRHLYRIPDGMASEDAAPLMCGGWTVWNALIGYDLKPTEHVGIIGIGGLGHFAIQLAKAMGCEITAFSGTESKREEALSLGAHHFINTRVEAGEKLSVKRPVDKLLITSSAHIDWNLYVPILAGRASVFPMQIPVDMGAPLSVPHMPFLLKSINVIYSTNGRHDAVDKLLAFAQLHGIKPISEKFPMTKEGIEKSIHKLEHNTMRYRGVLVV